MNSLTDAELSSEAFAQFAEFDAPLVEGKLAEANLSNVILFRPDEPAGLTL